MSDFDDVFHAHGDDQDESDDDNINFDEYTVNIDRDTEQPLLVDLPTEEQQLSQELSQLSTTTTDKKRPALTTTTINAKKMKIDQLPNYLSNNNGAFDRAMATLFDKATPINMEQLRMIAYLKNKLAEIELNTSLWTTYLRSGTGKMKEPGEEQETTRRPLRVWPEEMRATMLRSKSTTTNTENDVNDETCLNYVYKILRQLRDQTVSYQAQLDEKKKSMKSTFTVEIEDAIGRFVENHGTTRFRAYIQNKIAAVKHDYIDRALDLEFQEQNPYADQLESFRHLTQAKYEQDKEKCIVATLKHRLVHNDLPSSFDSLRLPMPVTLESITNEALRQRLADRCEKIFQRTKSDMMMVYIATAEAKAKEASMKFESELAAMNDIQRTGPMNKKFTGAMLDILHRRFHNINERLTYMYKCKLRFFVRAPTVTPSI